MKPIMDKPIKEKLQYAKDVLKDSVYERLVGLDMSYALTQEPVPFRERLSLSYAPIREGDVWAIPFGTADGSILQGIFPKRLQAGLFISLLILKGRGACFLPTAHRCAGSPTFPVNFLSDSDSPGKNISVFPKLRRRARRPTFGSKRETTICSEICARGRMGFLFRLPQRRRRIF